jgi:hypothetical protein
MKKGSRNLYSKVSPALGNKGRDHKQNTGVGNNLNPKQLHAHTLLGMVPKLKRY